MPRHHAERRRWPWLCLALASLLISGLILYDLASMAIWRPSLRVALPAPISLPAGGARPVRLFLPTEEGTLREVEHEMPRGSSTREELVGVLRRWGEERGSGWSTAEPAHLWLDSFGILYVDVGVQLEPRLAGAEASGPDLRALLATLAGNFASVKRVQFLVDGHELSAAVGRFDLRRPLTPEAEEPASAGAPEG